MGREIKTTYHDRVADLESQLASVQRQLAAVSLQGRMGGTQPIRLVQTGAADPADAADATYPVQGERPCRLPMRFLDVEWSDDGAGETNLAFRTRSSDPAAYLYSPFGWLPRGMILQAWQQNDRWMAWRVPDIQVEFSGDETIDPPKYVDCTTTLGTPLTLAGQTISAWCGSTVGASISGGYPFNTLTAGTEIKGGMLGWLRATRTETNPPVCRWQLLTIETWFTMAMHDLTPGAEEFTIHELR